MGRKVRVSFEANHSHEDMAIFPEVIAGDIRLGRASGAGSDYSWEIG
ncbi:MAG: hypothetical protein WCJ47_04055 [Methanomicrobiales archaeon]|jgi:hypothetical protein